VPADIDGVARGGVRGGHLMNLTFHEDELSRTYVLGDDPGFWVRVRTPVGDCLRISSVFQGGTSDSRTAEVLSEVFDRHVRAAVTSIAFADLAPGPGTEQMDVVAATARFDLLAAAVSDWVRTAERWVRNGYLEVHGDGFSAMFFLDRPSIG
jgi:hypothetical protein